jgi:hypothetical protein
LLHYIKSGIGVGSVYVNKRNNTADYRLRQTEHIVSYLLPIFDKYPLLTSKYYYYDLFKKAALILNDSNLTMLQKDVLLTELKKKSDIIPTGYISPA